MRILVVTNLYPPIARGGAEQVVARTVAELFVHGHKVNVLSTCPFSGVASLRARTTERDVETVYRFFPLNVYYQLRDHAHWFPLRLLWHVWDMVNPHAAHVMRTVLAQVEPDVVITHNLKGLGLSVVREIRRAGIAHVHVVHDVQLSIPSGLLIKGKERAFPNLPPLRTLYEAAVKWLIGSPNVVISPSRFLADFYQQRGFFKKSEVRVLPNPAPDSPARGRTTRNPGPVRLLYVGQLEDHKGIRFLLRTLERFHRPFELYIAGEGSLLPFVKRWAAQDTRIRYQGFISYEHLVKLFALSDAVIVPSLCYENSPTVIYEGMRSGVPVIAANIGGVGELVKDGETGFLFEAGNTNALLASLEQFTNDLDGWRARDDQIRAAIAPYALVSYVDALEQVLREQTQQG